MEHQPNHTDSILTWVVYFAGLIITFIEPVSIVLKLIAILITIVIGISKLHDIYLDKFKKK